MPLDAERIKARALEVGFDLAGIARAGPLPGRERVREWIARGYHAEMAWLSRDPDRRLDPALVLPGAQSLIVAGLSYYAEEPPPEIWNDPLRGRIARYAWGPDYHDELVPRLRELARWLESESGRPVLYKTYSDTGPVLERAWAERAGLGFIGKHTLLISPHWGSYLLLGVLIVNLDLEPDAPDPQSIGTCGQCRRCQDICPTHAFPAPYILDSRLCISYLTIEHRGAIPEALRPLMKNWIFGCDECQAICPWTRQFSRPGRTRLWRFDAERCAPSLIDLASLDEEAFRSRYRGTAMMRPKRRGFLRNVAVALGNSGRAEARDALERLARDDDLLVADHARWALDRLARQGCR